jgi:2-polyprenyl-6-methoxyphenol hydroxylase-like FAD-dependent oxidoreductase
MHDMGELTRLRVGAPIVARRAHAVVLGGGWTGLLAAAVLAPHFTRVTVLERDGASDLDCDGPPATPRPGVPHGAQSHIVLPYAARFLSALLPDLEALLARHGAPPPGDLGADFSWFQRGRWRLRQPLGLRTWFTSRLLLEWAVRQAVRQAWPHVEVRAGARVVGLSGSASTDVTGVRLEGAPGETTQVDADLVLDCTGRNSRGALWLAELGYAEVPCIEVDARTFYATMRVSRQATGGAGRAPFIRSFQGAPGERRGSDFAGAVTVENEELTLWTVHVGDRPPATAEAFAACLARLPVDALHRCLDPATVDASTARLRSLGAGPARRRRYDALSRHPARFVALGDAVCCTDPAFGLGLSLSASTVACLAAALNRRARQAGPTRPASAAGLGGEVARRVAWRTALPWMLTVAEDYRFPGTVGPHRDSAWVRLLQGYLDRAFRAAQVHADVDARVMHVVSLVAHPLQVFSPRIAGRVVQQFIREVHHERSIEAGNGGRQLHHQAEAPRE